MARQTAAEKRLDEARAAILYALNAHGSPLSRESLLPALPEGVGVDDFDGLLAELVADGALTMPDDDTYLATHDDDLDDDERVAVPTLRRRDGYGYVVIEAPLDLVDAYARLHPAEQGTMSVASAGALRQMLIEMGKMRPGRQLPDDSPLHAVVAPEV